MILAFKSDGSAEITSWARYFARKDLLLPGLCYCLFTIRYRSSILFYSYFMANTTICIGLLTDTYLFDMLIWLISTK